MGVHQVQDPLVGIYMLINKVPRRRLNHKAGGVLCL